MTTAKSGYHHGDLRNALIAAAVELAAADGPDAITIRAAARATGVTPPAVYRHFADRDELVSAVREQVVQRLTNATRDARDLWVVAREYVRFAAAEPGLFRTIAEPVNVHDLDDVGAWSSVHGLAVLLAGPLRSWPQAMKDAAVERVLAALKRGLESTVDSTSRRAA
ncbi:TetR/AcrR family transcriptional regulator [Actinocrispum wychmicini]|uniref:TetR family transcriptional regulator n=1 Tax=Actinocrispum wychmicini TaxID=1213861 RepID=A0A4R2J850_9PSEU|nr:TetR/AcrR family transcriptional regulator [Actinocrispum wychmicini]TCO54387.1 TetR family transcriptional regulator [Actinocrispum wychmicini]